VIPTYSGEDLEEGARIIAPLRRFGPPIADLVGPMPYTILQTMVDSAVPYPIRSYWKATYMNAMPDEAIDAFVANAAARVSLRTLALIEHAHGASARVAPDATAFALRGEPFDLVLLSMWDNAGEDQKNIEWTRSFYSAMQPWSAHSVYVNGLDQDDGGRVREAYGMNYARLSQVKATYDPENRFRRNQNIQPQFRSVQSATR
jgi:FAD/FMN-containing dehydrogenase